MTEEASSVAPGETFFVEPKVKTVRGVPRTRWELSRQLADNSTVVIGTHASKSAAVRAAENTVQ
ncbi:hypothetical protein [Mycobacteroides abscessus]|uniref:hypothetical protein n=1 Tax=Mycobacteroides abscessus TaxID=36809 RepID=UPI0012FFFCAA|nr:hypothetical protein [Mycobacteroides abscessus]